MLSKELISCRNYLNHCYNYTTSLMSETGKKITSNPSAVKKLLQVTTKLIAGYDLHTGTTHAPEFVRSAAGTIDLIEFYSTFKNIIFWINPFTKESIDQDGLKASIEKSVSSARQPTEKQLSNADLVTKVFDQVMKEKSYHNRNEVISTLLSALKEQGCDQDLSDKIAQGVEVHQKARPISLLISSMCFTIVDAAGNLKTLKVWGILDLSKLAAQIGSKHPVLSYFFVTGVGTTIGTLVCAGLSVSFGSSAHSFVTALRKHHSATEEKEKDDQYQKIRSSGLDMLSTGLDLLSAAAPFFFVVSPPVVIGLALVAKGTGLLVILVR